MENIAVVLLMCTFASAIRAFPHTVKYDADCVLTLEQGGYQIEDGADVSIALGSDLQVFCHAFCTGSGVSPAIHWYKDGEQVSSNLERIYYESTTFERNSVLHVLHSLHRDLGTYTCKGWLKGLGWRQKSFTLIKQCPDDQVRCDAHRCIDRTMICDGWYDCEDKSDEARCHACDASEFECDGKCMEKRFLCDYIQDCADGFDESDCARNCTEEEHRCGDGKCVQLSYRCDNFTDCDDKSDELDCCPAGTLPCEDGQCIEEARYCDGNFDCMDLTDEMDCGKEEEEEAIEEDTVPACIGFVCGNGECLPGLLQCDGKIDCWDGSDEDGCGSSTSTPDYDYSAFTATADPCTNGFQCDNGVCIPAEYECDGFVDCVDYSDEHSGCEATTPPSKEATTPPPTEATTPPPTEATTPPLTDATTPPPTEVTTPPPTEATTPPLTEATTPPTTTSGCSIDQFRCSDGRCIPDMMVCDNVPHCPNEEDENLAECHVMTCAENQSQCADKKQCYSNFKQCDGEEDCSDGSDEHGCRAH